MSRIHLSIERLVLKGFAPAEAQALSEALQSHLPEVLVDAATRGQWTRSHRTPVLRLGRISLGSGTAGATQFGAQLARGIGSGLKP
jgi:hypothetical protein